MDYGLPTSVEINGKQFAIRYDFRAILDIFEVMNAPELTGEDRCEAALQIFYPDYDDLTDYDTAIRECLKFINGGQEDEEKGKQRQLISWEQDFSYIISPINRIIGRDVRGIPYDTETNTGGLHWYTFLSAFYEIGDCLFAQIVSIRNKLASGKKLDKQEMKFYRQNQKIIDVRTQYTTAEDDLLSVWLGGSK